MLIEEQQKKGYQKAKKNEFPQKKKGINTSVDDERRELNKQEFKTYPDGIESKSKKIYM